MYSVQVLLFSALFTGCLSVESLRFLALGDWGGLPFWPYATPIEMAVGEQMGKITTAYQTSFNLALGDNFYFDGVTDVEDKRFFETFENIFKDESLQNPWYILAGNHDHYGNISAQIAYSNVSKRWNYPSLYYKVTYKIPGGGSIDILMLDTITLCGNTKSDFDYAQPLGPASVKDAEDQWAWLDQQLALSEADYLFAAGHFPVWSTAEHGPTKCLVQRLDPLLYKYGATGYLCGHDHNLQHLQTTKGNQKMDYFVIGAANYAEKSNKHAADIPAGSLKYFWAELLKLGGFAYFEATPANMTFKFIDGDRKQLYETVMLPRK